MPSGSRFAVAVHTLAVLGYLDQNGVRQTSSRMIARSVNTHPVVIRNLLQSLKAAGLVNSKEGRGGGVSLTRPSSKITLQEIYAAVEAEQLLPVHDHPEFKPCPVSRGMKRILPTLFGEIDRVVAKSLKGRTLQDIVEQIDA